MRLSWSRPRSPSTSSGHFGLDCPFDVSRSSLGARGNGLSCPYRVCELLPGLLHSSLGARGNGLSCQFRVSELLPGLLRSSLGGSGDRLCCQLVAVECDDASPDLLCSSLGARGNGLSCPFRVSELPPGLLHSSLGGSGDGFCCPSVGLTLCLLLPSHLILRSTSFTSGWYVMAPN